ncbi:MAG TPA: hypothetical protein VFJ30_18605 [Phycisphaerae bacterium]|nr:hypothetical protein [Phycisphaerae bacterium]
MSELADMDTEQMSFFDSVLAPELGKVRADGAPADGPPAGAAELVAAMVRHPGCWPQRMAELAAPGAWSDGEPAAPLPAAETVVLGYLLACNAREFGARAPVSVRAAALWYRSALAAAGDADALASPLDHYESVLTPVARAVAAVPALALSMGWELEAGFEIALSDLSDDPDRIAALRCRHAEAMQRVAWPLLRGAEPHAGYRLVLNAWVATGSEEVLRAGLIQLLDAPTRAAAEALAETTSMEAATVLLEAIRRHGRPLSGQVRANLAAWIQTVASNASETAGPSDRAELLAGLVEVLREA